MAIATEAVSNGVINYALSMTVRIAKLKKPHQRLRYACIGNAPCPLALRGPIGSGNHLSASKIRRWLRSWAFRSDVRLRHATIDNEISCIHEAALVRSEEQRGLRQLNRLSETPRWKVDLAAMPLRRVVTQPVLEKWRVERSRAQRIEAEAFTSVHDSQLARHG